MAAEKTVVIAGNGLLPSLVINRLQDQSTAVSILALPGFDTQPVSDSECRELSLENFADDLQRLKDQQYSRVVFAGSVMRPKQTMGGGRSACAVGSRFNILGGDDQVLRSIVEFVESLGFEVIGPHQIVPELLAAPGILTNHSPSPEDRLDTMRAAELVHALGKADAGQAAVVVCRLCVALETVSGTDRMLEFAAQSIDAVNPKPGSVSGVLYKAPKPNQDLRVDMPVIGLETVRLANEAGLAGIAVEAGGVLILEPHKTIAEADKVGLFVWARPPKHQ